MFRSLGRRLSLSLILLVIGLCSSLASGATCPPGNTPSADSRFCVKPGETYCGDGRICANGMSCLPSGRCFYQSGCWPEYLVDPAGETCIPPGKVACGGGKYCEAGETCGSDACDGAATPSGPRCGPNRLSPVGRLCSPTGGTYDPKIQKLCGPNTCDIRDECGADNECLSPFRQIPAMRSLPPSR